MPQLSKYPIGEFPKTVSAVFKKCGHPVQLMPSSPLLPPNPKGRVELEGYCWACEQIKRMK